MHNIATVCMLQDGLHLHDSLLATSMDTTGAAPCSWPQLCISAWLQVRISDPIGSSRWGSAWHWLTRCLLCQQRQTAPCSSCHLNAVRVPVIIHPIILHGENSMFIHPIAGHPYT